MVWGPPLPPVLPPIDTGDDGERDRQTEDSRDILNDLWLSLHSRGPGLNTSGAPGGNGGRGGAGGGREFFDQPKVAARIKAINGNWYFVYLILENPGAPPEYIVKTYHVQDVKIGDKDSEEQAYSNGREILSFPWKNSGQIKNSKVTRRVPDDYTDGYFFVQCEDANGKKWPPSPFCVFPSDASWIAPHPIKNFQIEEDGDFPQGSNQPFSRVTIAYDPPEDMTGFWGVALYVENYQGVEGIQSVTVRKYPQELANQPDPMDMFQVLLEPGYTLVRTNRLHGSSDSDYQTQMNNASPSFSGNEERALKILKFDGTNYTIGDDYARFHCQEYNAGTGTWADSDPANPFNSTAAARSAVRAGDTIVCGNSLSTSSGGSGLNGYTVEGIIDALDGTTPSRAFTAHLKTMPTMLPAGVNLSRQYLWWSIISSCKFYLVAINALGYHGDLSEEALVQYCALDGMESAPIPPSPVYAFQYEIQNTIKWYQSVSGANLNCIDHYTVYRKFLPVGGTASAWFKIGEVKSKPETQVRDYNIPYEWTDMDMSGIGGEMYDYYSGVEYGISATDKAGLESVIVRASCTLVDGSTGYTYIPFRRTVGADHSVYVVTRNNSLNLLYNSECNWDIDNGTLHGIGNAPYYEWSIRNVSVGPPGLASEVIYHTAPVAPAGVFTAASPAEEYSFRLDFGLSTDATASTRRDLFANLILQNNGATPAAGAWISSPAYAGLGRARLCVPGAGYLAPIESVKLEDVAVGANTRYILYVRPPVVAGIFGTTPQWPFTGVPNYSAAAVTHSIIPSNGVYISTGTGTASATDITPVTAAAIGAESRAFANGWEYSSSDTAPLIPTFTNGRLHIPRPNLSVTPTTTSWRQRIDKSWFYPGQFVTFTGQLKNANAIANPTGVVFTRIYLCTSNKYDPAVTIGGGGTWASDYSASAFNLAAVAQTAYNYNAFYMQIPNITDEEWATVTYVIVAIGTYWASNVGEVATGIYVSQPMLNLGNEAAPYTPQMIANPTWRLAGLTPVPAGGNPQNPAEDDPMCVHADSLIHLANGMDIKARKIKVGDKLCGWDKWELVNVTVQKVSLAKRKIIEVLLASGQKLRVSGDHYCMCFPPNGGFSGMAKLVAAKEMPVGDYMLCYDGKTQSWNQVIGVFKDLPETEQVVRITTDYPHNFFCDGILTHNLKAGEGDI